MAIRSAWSRCKELFAGRMLTLGQIVLVFALGFIVNWVWFASEPTVQGTPGAGDHQHGDAASQKWTCSMHPQIQKDGPGACPICGMDLIPVTSGKTMGLRFLVTTPEARELMNLQVTPVERRYVEAEIRMVGKVAYDETRLKYITAWVAGRLDRLFVDYTGVTVKEGEHMVNMYSEELYSAQQELIEAARAARKPREKRSILDTGGINLLESAREKLRLLGLSKKQIAEIEARDKPKVHVLINSPMTGVVVEKLRQQGDRVKVGDRIYGIADLTQLWIKMDAYEADFPWIRYGQTVEITTEAYPGMKPLIGRVAFIDPVLSERTRTAKVRVNIDNKKGQLKPEMFVHAVVRAKVAGEGRVIDPGLAGKWISPMHPEIIKDKPGKCDICGMPLVRAESLKYVVPGDRNRSAPLVIPVSAALMTGTRAIVYVELPKFPRDVLDKYQHVSDAMAHGALSKIRKEFSALKSALPKNNKLLRTDYARTLWNKLAGRVWETAAAGEMAGSKDDAQQAFDATKKALDRLQEHFSTPDKPTFSGRQVVLGPRAGDYYLVRHGLAEGELVVSSGSFKIDSALQISAKPSMMTPEGGGGGGHAHGGHGGGTKKDDGKPSTGGMQLPLAMKRALHQMMTVANSIEGLMKKRDLEAVRQKYTRIGQLLTGIDADGLEGHARMVWIDLKMLLKNDVYEGSRVVRGPQAQDALAKLQKTLKRADQQFGITGSDLGPQRYDVPAQFQQQLARVWQAYQKVGSALAADNAKLASAKTKELATALGKVDMKLLSDPPAHMAWMRELTNLRKILGSLSTASDIKSQREQFLPLSAVMKVLALSFGFGEQNPVYHLHCDMAFNRKGASWLQSNAQVRNPYWGSAMLNCAQQNYLIAGEKPKSSKKKHQHPK